MGAVVPQSEFARHATHACVDVWHFGLAAGQSVSALHCTQDCVVISQILAVAGQSIAVMHPTQAPVAVSHSSRAGQAAPPSAMQAAWQVWLPG
jgi:hypothetical protein